MDKMTIDNEVHQVRLEDSKLGNRLRKAAKIAGTLAVFPCIPAAYWGLGGYAYLESLEHLTKVPIIGEMAMTVGMVGIFAGGFGTLGALATACDDSALGLRESIDDAVVDFLRGIENRKSNSDVRLSDYLTGTMDPKHQRTLLHEIRSKLGNPNHGHQTNEGYLIETRAGFAYVGNDRMVKAVGENPQYVEDRKFSWSKGLMGVKSIRDDGKIVFGGQQNFGANGGDWASCAVYFLTCDTEMGAIQFARFGDRYYSAPSIVRRDEVDGRQVLLADREMHRGYDPSGYLNLVRSLSVFTPNNLKLADFSPSPQS